MISSHLARILIVDDEVTLMRALCDTLRDQGYDAVGFTTGEDGLKALREGEFDLLLTDLMMPGMDGVALLEAALRIDAQLVGIVMTGHGTIQTAVQAMQAGALDYILKPFKLSGVLPVLARAMAVRRLRLENLELRSTVAIHELNEAIAHTLDLNTLLDKIIDAAMAQLEGDEASLMLLCEEGGWLEVAAVRGNAREFLLGARVEVGQGVAGWVAANREPLMLDGVVTDPRITPPFPHADIRLALSMPIMTRGKVIGVINVNCLRRPRSFALGHIKALSLFTNAAAAAIDVAQLYQEQHRRNELYRKTLNHLNHAQRIAHIGSDFRDLRTGKLEVSDEFYRIFGVSPETFVVTAENIMAFVLPEDRQGLIDARALAESGTLPGPVECRIVRTDGQVRHLHREWEIGRDDTGKTITILGTTQDVTERVLIEEQLRHAVKMEAVGQLTGGLAHDFNNMIGVIIGNLELLENLMGSETDHQDMIADALAAALKCADLTHSLLAFARRQPLRTKTIDPAEAIDEIVGLIRRTLGGQFNLSVHKAPGLWPVMTDPTLLESAILNLCVNACDAMPGGGNLIIDVSNADLDADYIALNPDACTGEYVLISVTDTGSGMSGEVMAKAVDPFFTTKGVGRGSGLGLSMVFGFVKQANGHFKLYSELGVGTAAKIYLPRAATGEAVSAFKPVQAAPRATRRETILVADDNEGMRKIVLKQLSDLGYETIEAEDGRSALRTLSSGAKIDLLFTDVVMPGGINGYDLAAAARKLRPDLKVVFTSGFPSRAQETLCSLDADAVLLSKPYRQHDIAQALRAILDGSDRPC